MHKNQPYNRLLFDLILRKELAKNDKIKFEDVSHAFKSVAVVGMLLPEFSENTKEMNFDHLDISKGMNPLVDSGMIMTEQLWHEDLGMLNRTVASFSEAGIPLHPDAKFHIYNLLPPVGSDFLLHASGWHDVDFPKSDLVSINYIIKRGATPNMWRDYNTREGFSELKAEYMWEIEGNNKLTSVSNMHQAPDVWAEASFNAGAKFVVTHGGAQDEITTNELKNHSQSVVLLCSEKAEKLKRKNKVYGHAMGVVANKEVLDDYRRHANKENALGRALRKPSRMYF